MKTLLNLALLVALPGTGLLGYTLGAGALDDARAQLQAIDMASKQAELENEALRKRLEQELGTLKTEHERKTQQLSQQFQEEKLALSRSLASTAERLSSLQATRQQVAAGLEQTVRAQASAEGAHREELRKKEQELLALQARLENEQAGLACLSLLVPGSEVRILNQGQAHAERAHP